MTPVDILILSNGPGEVTTWVRPVVKALREQLGNNREEVRVSVVLSPCPNASGKEAAIALSYPEVDRVQAAEHFWQFLLWGKTFENWDWRDRGVIVFLGGDQFFPVVISKKLGYRTVVYAEWEARWHNLIDRFAVMNPELTAKVSPKYIHKFTVVGDLMLEAQKQLKTPNSQLSTPNSALSTPNSALSTPNSALSTPNSALSTPNSALSTPNSVLSTHNSALSTPNSALSTQHGLNAPLPLTALIGILPGSKAAKLTQGVPLFLAIAEYIHSKAPQTKFVIPVAPTLDLPTLASFADSQKNPFVETFNFSGASLVVPEQSHQKPILKTGKGLNVELHQENPAYDLLSDCSICLTTVGANTAELGALGVPMVVLLPTQQLDAMRSWDGLPGLLANLPGLGSTFAKIINWLFLRRKGLLAWPNIWAKAEIVPELIGKLHPEEVGEMILDFLTHPEKLADIRNKLKSVRGESGAADKIAQIVSEELRTWSN
ncbi:lipid-A-disaccharide synthase [Nostoc sp. UHCC 0870]|uniref:lipid-A-disaccharide synthase n=1 Tax=Nostoc sp. UHCC 0870 TaxID=2914041 RepID=UPI001EDCDA52|nr:lipid-A-disaccharide synthase [Nostoc sp. UHCC 0870]UKO96158.1 lipid-A-disaccharide synthase [Nostoc sp. UHCC 0870]